MAEQTKQISNIYALLIGIDGYTPSKSYPNLKGCVRDINLVEDYLKKTLRIPEERFWKQTSPNPEISVLSELRGSQKPNVLPTYENIVNAFKEITDMALPGELVYIHYSGHGGKPDTIYEELKGKGQADEGIVPMDVDAPAPGGRYLRDVEVATLLKRMTDKGLVVTVVFDSCHSGGATRGDTAIRGTENRDRQKRSTDSLVASREELIGNWQTLNEGPNPSVTQGGWLTKPKDYVFLAACRPSEFAFEYNVDGNNRHGALTYWMINTLTSGSPGLTYRMLYERINAVIQSKFREQQTPMLIGDSDRTIFGSENISYQYAISVIDVIEADGRPTRVKLSAGTATGLGLGAQFAIYPLGATNLSQKEAQIAIVEIQEVFASDSWAEVITPLGESKIEHGAQAVLLSPPVDLVQRVSLVRKNEGDGEDRLAPELIAQQEDALNAVEIAIAEQGWLRLVTDNQAKEDLQVAVNQKGEYEICMGLPLKNLTPALKINDDKAPQEVVKRLVHIAKYRAVQGLKNPFSDLANQLEVELIPQTSLPQDGATGLSNITLRSEEQAVLRIKNVSASPLNIVVLDLEPTWEISQLPLQRMVQKFYPFNPGQEIRTKLRLKLPDKANYDKGLEVIKVFAMFSPADFRWLELPSLDKEIPTAASRGLESPKGEATNALEELFAAIGTDPDRTPTERAQVIFDPGEEWATKEIQITVMR
ncbi:MAG: caspase family protein [Nostoc sp. SerVER01]|nr:caspase family protein [Nostoc sp. SerVER01]